MNDLIKPRLLIPLTVQFSVRYVIRTGLLEMIRKYATPVIVIAWEDDALQQELSDLGIENYRYPQKKIGRNYLRVLMQLTQWHLHKIQSPTTEIDRRRNKLINPPPKRRILRDWLYAFLTRIPVYRNFLFKQQRKLLWTDTNFTEYLEFIHRIKSDLIFCLTPYFIEEEFLLRAGQELWLPMCTSILSFDNLTTRGIIPILFNEYYLWNSFNESELVRIYPQTKDRVIKIVGAPQFDFYYQPEYLWSEKSWRKKLMIPESRPVILFSSTGRHIAPNEEEWLRHLDWAIETDEISGNPVILFRRHPNETMDRWENLKKASKNIIFDEPWKAGRIIPGKTNITRDDIEKLSSSLAYSVVHINASSTMTVDGAIFNKPQIGPAYAETGNFQRVDEELYLREHYLPITNSGGLVIVHSRTELIEAVNVAITNPEFNGKNRQLIVREICTYPDGKSTIRVNEALAGFVYRYAQVQK